MGLLTGEYRNSLDEKGRISFPSKLRSDLSELNSSKLVVTQSFDHCLWLYTAEDWEKLSSKVMAAASPFNPQHRNLVRQFIGPSQEIELDKSGRLSIPQSLRDYAGLKKDCVILGVSKFIEIWDADAYDKYLADNEGSFAEAAQALEVISFS